MGLLKSPRDVSNILWCSVAPGESRWQRLPLPVASVARSPTPSARRLRNQNRRRPCAASEMFGSAGARWSRKVAEKGHFVTAEHPDQRHFRFFYDRHERGGAAGGGRRQAPPSASLQGRAASPYRPSVKDGHSRRRAPPIPARHFCALRRLLRRSRPSITLRRDARESKS